VLRAEKEEVGVSIRLRHIYRYDIASEFVKENTKLRRGGGGGGRVSDRDRVR
jgi:hypothetical protein